LDDFPSRAITFCLFLQFGIVAVLHVSVAWSGAAEVTGPVEGIAFVHVAAIILFFHAIEVTRERDQSGMWRPPGAFDLESDVIPRSRQLDLSLMPLDMELDIMGSSQLRRRYQAQIIG
jgi:hypothetical protein